MKPLLPLTLFFVLTTFTQGSEQSPHFQVHGDHQVDSFPLKSSHSEVSITGPIAQVELSQTYANEGDRTIDATYLFPASTKAAVHGMTMQIGERTINAEIQEKEKARATFEKAKTENKSASLLTQKRPNLFSMEVTKILPGNELTLTLRYSEILVPHSNSYEFVIPTAIGPRYSEGTKHEDRVSNPFLNEGEKSPTRFSVNLALTSPLPIKALACPSHDLAGISFTSKTSATLKLPTTHPDRDFILRYRLAGEKIQSGLLTHQGENENTFLFQLAPPSKVTADDIPERDFVFVIDVSGSMKGFPLNLAKDLFKDLAETLRPEDRFKMLLFAGANQLLSPKSLPATSGNIERALAFLEKAHGNGGTRLINALEQALDLPHDRDRSRSLVIITDGFIDAEARVFDLIKEKAEGTNIFPLGVGSSVNRHLIEGLSHFAGHDHFIVSHSSESVKASQRFRKIISTPVLTNIQIEASEGITLSDLLPARQPDLFEGQPLSLVGKWEGNRHGSITMSGTTGDGQKITQTFELNPESKQDSLPVLWARAKVRELADFAVLTDRESAKKEVTALGLKYELLTPFTSFVAVAPESREDQSESLAITQAQPLPKGVSQSAKSGGSSGSVPEPSSSLLVIMVALLTVNLRIRA
jgi:Ca-activated chloride channel family protein